MPKKHDKEKDRGKAAKVVVGDRWTVRGVSPTLQKAAGAAARAQSMTVGQWLCKAIDSALDAGPTGPEGEDWRGSVELRLRQLEMALLAADAPPPAAAAPEAPLSAPAPSPVCEQPVAPAAHKPKHKAKADAALEHAAHA